MTEENVDVTLRMGDALNLHELSEEDIAPFVTPDWTGENVRTAVTDKTYHGSAGVLQWRMDLIDVFAEGVDIEGEVLADGVDFVVVRMVIVGKGACTHGYAVDDVRDAPDRPEREFVFIARRPG